MGGWRRLWSNLSTVWLIGVLKRVSMYNTKNAVKVWALCWSKVVSEFV